MSSAASLGGGSEIIPYNSLFYCKVNLVFSLQSLSQGEGGWVCSAVTGPGSRNRKTGFYDSQPVGIAVSQSIIFAAPSGAALLIEPLRRAFPPCVCCSTGTSLGFVTKAGAGGGKPSHLGVFNVCLEHMGNGMSVLTTSPSTPHAVLR